MERKSIVWIWAGLGVVAVVIFIASGMGRKPRLELTTSPNPSQPIIVEPIQPNNASQTALVTPIEGTSVPAVTTPAGTATAAQTLATSAAESVPSSAATPLPSEGQDKVRKIQQALSAAGYNPGPVDGKMGRMTQKAIRDFQEANGLSVDGKVGPKTWAKLAPYLNSSTSSTASNP